MTEKKPVWADMGSERARELLDLMGALATAQFTNAVQVRPELRPNGLLLTFTRGNVGVMLEAHYDGKDGKWTFKWQTESYVDQGCIVSAISCLSGYADLTNAMFAELTGSEVEQDDTLG